MTAPWCGAARRDARSSTAMGRVTVGFLRWLGLAGSLMLAGAGRLGGAFPSADLEATPLSVARGPYGPIIIGLWLAGTAITSYAWWTLRDRVPTLRWGLVTAALWLLPFLFTPPMGSRDVYSYACQGEMFTHGLDPYRQGVSALPCTWLNTVAEIWRDTVTPYGPLFILIAGAAVAVGKTLTGTIVVFRLITLAAIVVVAACLPALARRCGIAPERAIWVALAGPLVGAHMLAAPHNDAVMIGLLVAGLYLIVRAQARPIPLLTGGVLLGLAVAVKATAIVVIPFAALIAMRKATGPDGWRGLRTEIGPLAKAAALVGGSSVLALLAVTVASGLGFGWVPAMQGSTTIIQFTSPPTAVGMTLTYAGQALFPGFDAVPAVRAVALVALATVLVMLFVAALRDADRDRAALRGAAFGMAAVVLLSPVFHPWYAMWPLTLLAAVTLRTSTFMWISIVAAFSVMPDGGGLPRFVKFPGAPLMTVFLIVLAVRFYRRRTAVTQPDPQQATFP
ncbi:polyprenol phosphomannose-dependent alpha 1,6 mannosyltransferase MptB [Actinoplanes sichuanensis]|uniref:Polyprenol phosphomannose-dependent alpha 1,6 mannosyltransferase MptB n=1 Tax=Actinoplanes sichuanensis TaxID=512349 RepID=A0ABW4A5S6_9ACTN|nr:polyprenol phosphomannose-dependent alpha 1,6 mannosyltransferase MptB [Actinoplanes sichuanensis]